MKNKLIIAVTLTFGILGLTQLNFAMQSDSEVYDVDEYQENICAMCGKQELDGYSFIWLPGEHGKAYPVHNICYNQHREFKRNEQDHKTKSNICLCLIGLFGAGLLINEYLGLN